MGQIVGKFSSFLFCKQRHIHPIINVHSLISSLVYTLPSMHSFLCGQVILLTHPSALLERNDLIPHVRNFLDYHVFCDRLVTIIFVGQQASAYLKQGKYKAAEQLYKEVCSC